MLAMQCDEIYVGFKLINATRNRINCNGLKLMNEKAAIVSKFKILPNTNFESAIQSWLEFNLSWKPFNKSNSRLTLQVSRRSSPETFSNLWCSLILPPEIFSYDVHFAASTNSHKRQLFCL